MGELQIFLLSCSVSSAFLCFLGSLIFSRLFRLDRNIYVDLGRRGVERSRQTRRVDAFISFQFCVFEIVDL